MTFTFLYSGSLPRSRRRSQGPGALLSASIVLLVVMCAGCGWYFADRTDAIPRDLKTVSIPLWKNDTAEPGIETLFTNAMVKEFAAKGWLRPTSFGRADTVLEGRIEHIDIQPLSFSSVAIELENRVTVTASVVLKRKEDQTILWSVSRLVGREEYDSTPDFNVNLRNREQALRKLATDLAGSVHDEIFRVY
jgi:hypothetical protein